MKILQIGLGKWGKNHFRIWNELNQELCVAKLHSEDKIFSMYHLDKSKITTNFKDFLKEVGAIDIVTPPNTHYQIAKECLEAGKDVLIEKPIAMKSKEALELIELAKKNKSIIQIGHTFRFSPLIAYTKEQVDSGKLGKVRYIAGEFSGFKSDITDNEVGVVLEHGVHFLDLFNYLIGKSPKSVTAVLRCFIKGDKEDVAIINLNYEGSLAKLELAYLTPKKVRHLTIAGEKAIITIDFNTQRLEFHYKTHKLIGGKWQGIDERIEIPKINLKEPLTLELQHFLDCIKSRKVPISDAESSYLVLKTIGAVFKSSEEKKEIPINN